MSKCGRTAGPRRARLRAVVRCAALHVRTCRIHAKKRGGRETALLSSLAKQTTADHLKNGPRSPRRRAVRPHARAGVRPSARCPPPRAALPTELECFFTHARARRRQLTTYASIAGYVPASDVVPHSMIDLDMEEIVSAVGNNDITEAIRIYTSGGNGLCSAADVADTTIVQCTATTDVKGNSVKGSGAIRTIKGFATSGEAKMTKWTTYPVYKAYYNDFNYADTFITNAATHTNANGDDDQFRQQMIKKGAAYMAVWMYVLHEFEDAIADCTTGDVTANDDSVHAWDEGWAFYAGSAVGTDGADSGDLLYGLANSRCKNFGTCASGATGLANANSKALAAAIAGRDDITTAKCTGGVAQLKILTEQMTIPLIQGTLKYAWEADPAMTGSACAGQSGTFDASCSKAWAEGWTFAAAILPQLNACSAAAAKTVKDNLDASLAAPMKDGLAAVKAAIEACYPSMGITCDEVGEYQSSGVVFSGMAKCTDPVASSDSASAPALALGAAAAAAGALLL